MALTPEQIATVKSTAGVVKEHSHAITTTFYRNMLTAHPELKNYFSIRNQQGGFQQAALANALAAYATYIDDLPKLSKAVEHIAQKHASLLVKPEQYAVVGKFLVEAFAEILGDALTPDIAEAWIAAYGQLADIFIQREKQLYDQAGEWKGWRSFEIVKKELVSEHVVSFYLSPVDGKPLPNFLPGQYVSVQIPIPELDGLLQNRQFSLSLAPKTGGSGMDYYRITVKRDQVVDSASSEDLLNGKVPGLVSSKLHDSYNVGDEVHVSSPRGDFVADASKLPPTAPVVLLSAGVGATPMVSILDTVCSVKSSRPVYWAHGARHSGAVCYGKHVREVASDHENVTANIFLQAVAESDQQGQDYDYKGRMSLDTLENDKVLPVGDDTAEYFICGPEGWMLETQSWLEGKGVSSNKVHLELFRTGSV